VIVSIQEKFGDTLIDQLDDLNENLILQIVDEIKTVNKIKDQDKLDEVREHLLFNIKLIRLSVKVFPDEIRDLLDEFFSTYEIKSFNQREFNNLKNNLTLI
jgi:hypothetical protein